MDMEEKKYLGETDKGILWAEQSLELSQPWVDKRKVSLDKHQNDGEADYYYLISIEKHLGSNKIEPYFVIEFYNTYRDDPPKPFGNYLVRWHDYILIANKWCFHGINLRTFETKRYPEFEIEYIDQVAVTVNDFGVFDRFYEIDGYLLVTDLIYIYCFDEHCSLVWITSDYVGHEGVSIIGYNNGFLEVRGEDWSCNYYFLSTVDIKTGDVVINESKNYETKE